MEQELLDSTAIRLAKQTRLEEVEPLYWKLEDALYDGKIDSAKGFYELFLYIAKYQKDVLSGLRKRHLDRLKEIAYELHDTETFKKRSPVVMKRSVEAKVLPFKQESELQQYLASHLDLLSESLGDHITECDLEVSVDSEYRCDLVASSDTTCYPIELKIGQANHQVVSQCNKYCFYLFRKLRYSRYKDVQGVVCCNGFDDWSINELRQEGIWCFDIVPVDKGIKLRRV